MTPGLHGVGDIPPLAGRSPTMLFRQLEAFDGGTRHAAADEPMRIEVAHLTSTDFIELAAFIGSLSPSLKIQCTRASSSAKLDSRR
jgi:cytochrome c553